MLCGTDLHSIRSFSVASPTKYLEFPNNIIRAAVESRGQNRIVVVREGGDGQFDNDSNILSIFSSYQSRHLAYLLKKKNHSHKTKTKKSLKFVPTHTKNADYTYLSWDFVLPIQMIYVPKVISWIRNLHFNGLKNHCMFNDYICIL